jgi:hypothetical protein
MRFSLINIAFMMLLPALSVSAKDLTYTCNNYALDAELRECRQKLKSILIDEIVLAFEAMHSKNKFYTKIRNKHNDFMKTPDVDNHHALLEHRDFLVFISSIVSCLKQHNPFHYCYSILEDNEYAKCVLSDDASTYILGRCSSSMYDALTLIYDVLNMGQMLMVDRDPSVQSPHMFAHLNWLKFVESECEWQSNEYRGGSIASYVYQRCQLDLYRDRIDLMDKDLRLRPKYTY